MLFFCYNDRDRLDRKEEVNMSFKDFNLKTFIQEALDEIKFKEPSRVSKNGIYSRFHSNYCIYNFLYCPFIPNI